MTSQVTDILEAIQSFVAEGYDREYRLKGGNLVDHELGSTLDPGAIPIDTPVRLEIEGDAEDASNTSNIYAISDPATGTKGLLIYAYDVADEAFHRNLSERLVAHRETAPAGDKDVRSKNGMRQVYKDEFEREPERYVLRQGFPDFPPCPFGGAFSILGFDTVEQSYVWLVTSIIRDSRLIRISYQGKDVISKD